MNRTWPAANKSVWGPKRLAARITTVVNVSDKRPEPKRVTSILKRPVSRNLVRCPEEWLPEEDAHLAVSIEPEEPRRRKSVWFPVDQSGEPHHKNPDDGCGGAKFELTNTREFAKFVPNEYEKREKNNSANAYRWLMDQTRFMALLTHHQKLALWATYEAKMKNIAIPEYDYIGGGWRLLFKGMPRLEE